ncbi:hypothetical protein HYW55_00825 [Candidatus Gottesmanbacteria bacterium]|nr:hypothetical protein [Candidatus Gottesmanbacteria bacterium]
MHNAEVSKSPSLKEKNMSTQQDARLAELRKKLKGKQGKKLPPQLRRFALAVFGGEETSVSHKFVLNALPSYVQAEASGDPVAKMFPAVKQHLDRCESCAQMYVELLDLSLAEIEGRLPVVLHLPAPDLSFLRVRHPSQERWRQYVNASNPAKSFPKTWKHLQKCKQCQETYAAILKEEEEKRSRHKPT